MQRPLIGITAYPVANPDYGWQYDASYAGNARAIERAGGLPVLIPATVAESTLRAIYERLDGVMLPGGGDVDPALYTTEERHPTVHKVSDERDRAEMALTRWAYEDNLPAFGICRGIQVMNVALGGTLVQDIPSQVNTELLHDLPNDQPRSTLLHDVQIEQDSQLGSILGDIQVRVNSLHHQAVGAIAPLVKLAARATDGVIEAFEVPNKDFIMAVQWHPEDLIDNDPRMLKLFEAFVAAARERMLAKASR